MSKPLKRTWKQRTKSLRLQVENLYSLLELKAAECYYLFGVSAKCNGLNARVTGAFKRNCKHEPILSLLKSCGGSAWLVRNTYIYISQVTLALGCRWAHLGK